MLARPLDYTDRDFDSVVLRLRSLIDAALPTWTDDNRASFGTLVIELYAYSLDILTYYLDALGRETRWGQATQRKSLLALVKLIGYVPSGPTAAQVQVTITLAAVPVGSVTFPAGTVVRSIGSTPAEYRLVAAAVIGAGQNPPTVSAAAVNSVPRQEVFPPSGDPNQRVVLGFAPYVHGTAVVSAGNGAYTVVQNFLSSGALDRHCVVSVDHHDRATIVFGDGVNGAVPTGSKTVQYRTGGGAAGRVSAGAIQQIVGTFTDSFANPVSPSVTNAADSEGGNDRASNALIRLLAPASLTALTRSVAREDFEVNALRHNDVGKALFLSSDEDSDVPENQGRLYVVPKAGGLPSAGLKAAVLTLVTETYPCPVTFTPTVLDPPYLEVNVVASVRLHAGVDAGVVRARLDAAVEAHFAVMTTDQNGDEVPNPAVLFGYQYQDQDGNVLSAFPHHDLRAVLRAVPGVFSLLEGDLLLNGVAADVALERRQFPVLGTVAWFDALTGDPL